MDGDELYDPGGLARLRAELEAGEEYARAGSSWKQEWYARGPRVTVDARPFLAERAAR